MKDTKRPQAKTPMHTGGNNVICAEFARPAKPFGLIEFIRERGIPRNSIAYNSGVVTSIIRLANDNAHA